MAAVTDATEVSTVDPSEEIVALICTTKPNMGLTDAEKVALRIHVVKAGQPAFYLKAGQFAKMKRGVADWHVSKSRAYDATNKLMLSVISLEEAMGLKNKTQAKVLTRDEMVKQAIEKGLLKDAAEATDDEGVVLVSDETLKELLGL